MMKHFVLGLQLLLGIGWISNGYIDYTARKNQPPIEIQSPQTNDMNLLKRYTEYNHWANEQFAEWLQSASEEQLNQEIESSFSSLKETVLHIWGAEYLWLQVVKDQSTENNPAKSFEGTKEELLEGWLQASQNFRDHVQGMSTEAIESERTRGERVTVIADMIHHCMNHSTYHRGQLITMGRQAGLSDPPRTDFIYYVSLDGE